MSTQPETRLQRRIQKALKKTFPNSWWFKVWGGPFQSAGIPDLIGCVEGHFMSLEVKVPEKGEPSTIQLETMATIREAGGLSLIVVSVEEALWAVSAATKLLRYEVNEATGCWDYIHASAGTIIEGKFWGIPRLSWTLFKGPIPDGLFVCHECDNPRCMNPDHLWLGTHQDNVDDREAKGRGRRLHGEDSPNAKLTLRQVEELRSLRETKGIKLSVLAKRYNISVSQASLICSGKKWKHAKSVAVVGRTDTRL